MYKTYSKKKFAKKTKPYRKTFRATRGGRGPVASVQKAIMSRMIAQPCTIKWLESLLDPFNGPQDACNPYTPPIFSERNRAWVRSQLSAANFGSDDAAGSAIICARMQPANNQACMTYSTTAGYDSFTDIIGETGQTPTNNNSRYIDSVFLTETGSNQWAPVSLGVRIRYTGPAEKMQGRLFMFESDPHEDQVANEATVLNVMAQNNVIELPITYEWQTLVWSGPVLTNEFNYNTAVDNQAANPYCLVLLLFGVNDTTAQSFAVEYTCNFEVTGVVARSTQMSERDTEGSGNIQSAIINSKRGKSVTGVGGSGASARKPTIWQQAVSQVFPDYATPNPKYGVQWSWLDQGVQLAAAAASDYFL